MYSRLSIEEREVIARDLARHEKVADISSKLRRNRATIYREINRLGQDRNDYSPNYSHADALEKQTRKRKGKKKINGQLKEWIEEHLKKRWSPEEISRYLKINVDFSFHISHESIYQYIYSQEGEKRKELIFCLRQRKKQRRRRKSVLEKRGKIKNAISIHERPKEIEDRNTFGHWEGDLIIGKDHKSAIGTLVERSSRLVKIVPLPKGKNSISVIRSFAQALSAIPLDLKKSLTYDRGQEMALHEMFTELTGTKVYFADPRAPWQRGTNENTNGLIRDFFPKKTDFSEYSETDFQQVEDLLNSRPRKVIGFKTPREVFERARDLPRSVRTKT